MIESVRFRCLALIYKMSLCPKAEVGNFFYLPKFNIYNLTGYYCVTRTVYCAIWTEVQQGRGGNVLASAFRKILDRVLEDNDIVI